MQELMGQSCYVILHIGVGPSHYDNSASPLIVTDSNRFVLNDEIWIEKLDEQLAINIQKACSPPHYKIISEAYDNHLYAFVRQVPATEKTKYEGMNDLFGLTALSRIIRPTSTGARYCARVFEFPQTDSRIESVQFRGISPDVILSPKHQDWLSVADGEELRKLVRWLSADKKMHPRIHRAYWNHEYAMRSYYIDTRLPLVVSGLEALINVGGDHVSQQFHQCALQLSTELGINLTDNDLHYAYQLRSKLVHAEGFLYDYQTILPHEQHTDLYEKLENLLRETIKRCLLDERFGDNFRNDATVRAKWPFEKISKMKR